MKLDLIVPGAQYVATLKPGHILVPGTNITYSERLAQFDGLDLGALPLAATRERKRLEGAIREGLASRIARCEGANKRFFGDHEIGAVHWLDRRIGTIVTVVAKQPKAVTVEAEFKAQQPRTWVNPVGPYFDPSIPDEDPNPDDSDEDDWTEYDDMLLDGAGTLRAVVHPAAIRWVYDDGLIERLNAEHEERIRRVRAEMKKRERRLLEERAGGIMERAAEEILRDANRPPDDEWEALA